MLALEQECGLRVARHRIETVADKDVLLVQRFDRTLIAEGYLRHRMVSGLTALGAEDSHGTVPNDPTCCSPMSCDGAARGRTRIWESCSAAWCSMPWSRIPTITLATMH